MSKFHNIAVILAGGSGKRVGGNLPKQLRTLPDGRTMLETCIDTFRSCLGIDEVVVVMHPDWTAYVPKDIQVIEGGNERWESSLHAVQALALTHIPDTTNILLHDCARPFVSVDIIERVCAALETHEAVTVAVPAVDTIYRTENQKLIEIPKRTTMMHAQTPQAFRLTVIAEAFKRALDNTEGITATDDAGIILRYMPDSPIIIVEGSEQNRKVTFAEDLC